MAKLEKPPAGHPFTRALTDDEKNYLLKLARQYTVVCEPPEGRNAEEVIKEVGELAKVAKANPIDILKDLFADKGVKPVEQSDEKPAPAAGVTRTPLFPTEDMPAPAPVITAPASPFAADAPRVRTNPAPAPQNTELAEYDEGSEMIEAPRSIMAVGVVDVNRAVANFRSFQELKARLLDATDFQVIKTSQGDRKFPKKSAWRKMGAAFNVTDEIVSSTREVENGVVKWTFVVKATTAGGRSSIGVGMCASNEKQGRQFIEHNVFATAHTRAKNRAISDLIGGGEVSAEEVGQ